jgi:hypothetical protein
MGSQVKGERLKGKGRTKDSGLKTKDKDQELET